MYEVIKNGRTVLEADACGIGFVVSRKGVPDRRIVEDALGLCGCFDHRGAPGHGAGIQLDIPWPLLLERFPAHAKLIAQRDVALATFFLPFDGTLRRRCVEAVEELSAKAGSPVLQWSNVPMDLSVLPPDSKARRMAPVVRQALLRRPEGMSEEGWFASRYLLRLALDRAVGALAGDEFSVVSLSNRTVVYKGLVVLSRIADLYSDLRSPDFASRFATFHSRYSTNTSTAWRRAQPFWALAHNGEINTIKGNVAWFEAIGRDLLERLRRRHPALAPMVDEAQSVICSGGSDTANLDDMLIALMAGGMTLSQSVLALLPSADREEDSPEIRNFFRAMSLYLGACDGPAATVTCDGDEAIAHLDRNGLRPLWVAADAEVVVAASELTGSLPRGDLEFQRILGPGETVAVNLATGAIRMDSAVRERLGRLPFPSPNGRIVPGGEVPLEESWTDLLRLQRAFGMTKEDVDVVLAPLADTGKPAVGSMGDDTSPSAMLDALPRRIEDHFALRFAQETSPPIDPIRDAWVFAPGVDLGDRSGLWDGQGGAAYTFPTRVLSRARTAWLKGRSDVAVVSLVFPAALGAAGLEAKLDEVVDEVTLAVGESAVVVLSDLGVGPDAAAAPILRAVSRAHSRLVERGLRHRIGIVAEGGVWDIHHCALLIAVGADAVAPWLGSALAGEREARYLDGIQSGVTETMSMIGVTPSAAYCGARLVEAIGLDREFLAAEFPGVPGHLGGIGAATLNEEWLGFHEAAYCPDAALPDAGEYRHTKEGRPHANNAEIVRLLQSASGYAKKIHLSPPGTWEAYRDYARLVADRRPVTLLDLLEIAPGEPIPLDEVEPEEAILWRFMAPGMSEGALSEPAHRAVAKGLNLVRRLCAIRATQGGFALPPGIGPIANSGEGGFEKSRMGRRDGNRSVQYAGGRFTITPMTAASALEAEVKFAQGAKPGKGGQLPGKKVTEYVARQRGCEPGYELVSPPINHNLYSIEDVKLMVESWRHLNPTIGCALKYVATYGVEMVFLGGVNAGATRLHLSDGSGGTGAAKRVDQKHAGAPLVALLPTVQDTLVEEGVRDRIELSVDGGVQTGRQALKLMLLGADRVGFGTSLLIAIGCSMLRKCHLAGPDPADPSGKRRLGCTPGVATQDPAHVARFSGDGKHIARYLRFAAREIRETMAAHGIRSLSEVIGRRDLLVRREGLTGKAARLRLDSVLNAPHEASLERDLAKQAREHLPKLREEEVEAAAAALGGKTVYLRDRLTNEDRCVGMRAAGVIARARGDLGLAQGRVRFEHEGAAGHFYASYLVDGLDLRLTGVAADSVFTASYGGRLAILPPGGDADLTVVGNAFGYGARGGRAYIAGRAGNRFGICLRKSTEGGGPRIVVEGVEANAFQYMTGGVVLVLGSVGANLGSGMTGGVVYALDLDPGRLNAKYVGASPLSEGDVATVRDLLREHAGETGSERAATQLEAFDPARFSAVRTVVVPEDWTR